ncbi:MAG: oxygen-independent coproporphyrinogen III oxidase [Gemmatimonadota bacterium]|nr:oxygen-independent coproporphyrinogen III oxidase [Gemmatimonadota bacterium]MDP6530076.1 oxygen-independent coproporphyrinogen III oxidase [Gemmatimonadota bacterium]MDP7032414.1 oxygen-independent coproporphyrinogen III oxidase [Gemmatimonadota bacterium]
MIGDIPAALLRKYDRPGPRYTSYPTAPVWTDRFGEEEYRDALAEVADRPADDLSIYFHVPFCASHCDYCGCNALVSREDGARDAYLDRVEREVERVTAVLGRGRRVTQLHWGGGTPNFLRDGQIRRAMSIFRRAFEVAPRAEVSIEIDPRIGTAHQMEHLRSAGFNRVSLGVQDFNRDVQQAIGRLQRESRTRALYASCRGVGFDSVNLDLVYGLPNQTLDSFGATLDGILDLAPDRVACYGYAHVPWVRPMQAKLEEARMPTPDERVALFRLAVERFTDAGYEWIGMDHFARKDDELSVAHRARRLHRNFMGYTTRPAPHMLAFGMSGIGDLAGRFVQNAPDLLEWESAVDAGGLPVVKGLVLTAEDRLRRAAILHMMCNLELPWTFHADGREVRVREEWEDELVRLRPLEEDGLVEFGETALRITETGRFFLRNVCMEFDAHLDRTGEKTVFSRTV